MNEAVLLHPHFPDLNHLSSGKVRDMYDLGSKLLIVTSDRLSAFDVVMANGIPFKGKVLNRLSEFWFDFLKVPHHMITCEVDQMPSEVRKYRSLLKDRSMLVKKASPFPVECVARGYLIGSGWKDYQKTGEISGVRLPKGLAQASRLESPIFTPATKATTGHDENIGFDEVKKLLGESTGNILKDLTLSIFQKASAYAQTKGLILADTKFEFGTVDGQITLIDEVLTPDSSRYWPESEYKVGTSPPSFDKQFVRDYLETIHFNKNPPGPVLPDKIVTKTSEKYLRAYSILTGREFLA